MTAQSNAPIIIKRKKVIAGGHHGGAWKVAYADFVTAMMAFFLLMWLLGATTEKQRKGIADYFNPTIPVNKVSGGGDGAFGGDSVFQENTLAYNGTGASMLHTTDQQEAKGSTGIDDGEDAKSDPKNESDLAELAEMMAGVGGESLVSDLLARHILTRVTDEGLIVEVFDLPDAPLFQNGAAPTETLNVIVRSIFEVFRLASNDVAVQAHTASVPIVSIANPVWEDSATRANSVRELLVETGLAANRMQRVTGFADSKLATRNPLSVRNNRIEIILLRSRL